MSKRPKMRVLFISSSNMMATDLAHVMQREGHHVKLLIDDADRKDNFKGLVSKTEDWRDALSWVGRGPASLTVFDDIGYGAIQDRLRRDGYSVFGGSALADKLETNRQYAHEIFVDVGIQTAPVRNFDSIASAIKFLNRTKGAWVLKQNGGDSKSLNHVTELDDSRDIVNLLENYRRTLNGQMRTVTLQRKVEGVEIAVGRFFNGVDWVGPVEMNIEHKRFLPGDVGPMTSEMGTLAWYDDDEDNKLFRETLGKLKGHLQAINYRGEIDLNCIVNEHGAYPLEATPRLGSPIIYLLDELHRSPWGELLKAIADGQRYDLKWKRGFGLVVLVAVPPFPYAKKLREVSPKGINIYFDRHLKERDFEHIHLEGVSARNEHGRKQYYVSDEQGYVLYVTSVQLSVEAARKETSRIIRGIHVPKMMYRNDIGVRFLTDSRRKLRRWGYL